MNDTPVQSYKSSGARLLAVSRLSWAAAIGRFLSVATGSDRPKLPLMVSIKPKAVHSNANGNSHSHSSFKRSNNFLGSFISLWSARSK